MPCLYILLCNVCAYLCIVRFQEITSDPIIINTIFTVGKTVHDTLNALSFQDEVRQSSRLIGSFINKVPSKNLASFNFFRSTLELTWKNI